jgi:hypothetical protein
MRVYISSNKAILVNHTLFAHESQIIHPKHKRLNIETVSAAAAPEIAASRSPAAQHPHKQTASDGALCICASER